MPWYKEGFCYMFNKWIIQDKRKYLTIICHIRVLSCSWEASTFSKYQNAGHLCMGNMHVCVNSWCPCKQVCSSVCSCCVHAIRHAITMSTLKRIQKLLSIPKEPSLSLGSAQLVALPSIALVLGNMLLILSEQMVQGVLLKTVLPGGKFMLYKCTSKLCYLI